MRFTDNINIEKCIQLFPSNACSAVNGCRQNESDKNITSLNDGFVSFCLLQMLTDGLEW